MILNKVVHISICIHFHRWDSDSLFAVKYDMNETEKIQTFRGVFLDGIEVSGSSFFRILEAKAAAMRPHQCILLEFSYVVFQDKATNGRF